jgi:hypothetical protein
MRRSLWLAASCLLAFGLSVAYLHVYLRGGPRVIDATSYWLEARSLAAGSFSFPASEPVASFAGRFLLATPDGRLGVIFPPGYPLVLSLGMRLGAGLWVGPMLGALLVAVTCALGRALAQEWRVALTAAALSAVCAALRYHTADTMSHGLATLLGCAALVCALRHERAFAPLGAGLCLGLLAATRPVSAAASLCVVMLALNRARARPRAWLWLALGALPGLCLLLAQQRALTGSLFGSAQLAYYAASDSSPECFRYGFGRSIGCRYEHGDYISRFMPDGYGAMAALRNLVVRFSAFSTDATNAAPLTLLALYALYRHRRSSLALLGAAILLQALAYLPFYFDGNYPGGGARFLCEVIPACQILVARAAFDLKLGRMPLPVALAGFLLHARTAHESLRDREGGRPMFEPALVQAAGLTRGLLFVDTDHGFNLGHDPSLRDPTQGLVVARRRGDAHDRELLEHAGNPLAFHYRFEPTGRAAPRVDRYEPPPEPRFESEAEWPANPQRGSAYPIHFPCASAGRALRLKPTARVDLPVPKPAQALELGWVNTAPEAAELAVQWGSGERQVLRPAGRGCSRWRLIGPSASPHGALSVELTRGQGAVDFLHALP